VNRHFVLTRGFFIEHGRIRVPSSFWPVHLAFPQLKSLQLPPVGRFEDWQLLGGVLFCSFEVPGHREDCVDVLRVVFQ